VRNYPSLDVIRSLIRDCATVKPAYFRAVLTLCVRAAANCPNPLSRLSDLVLAAPLPRRLDARPADSTKRTFSSSGRMSVNDPLRTFVRAVGGRKGLLAQVISLMERPVRTATVQ